MFEPSVLVEVDRDAVFGHGGSSPDSATQHDTNPADVCLVIHAVVGFAAFAAPMSEAGVELLTLRFTFGGGQDAGATQSCDRLQQHLDFEASLVSTGDGPVERFTG